MLYEFAVDPEAIGSDYHSARLILGTIGVEHGRIISTLRKKRKWRNDVIKTAEKKLTYKQKTYLVDEIRFMGPNKLAERRYSWDSELGWLKNAQRSHDDEAFQGIIVKEKVLESSPHLCRASEVLDNWAAWGAVRRDNFIPRDANVFSNHVRKLLQISEKISFIDWRFEPSRASWYPVVIKCIHTALEGGSSKKEFEFHIRNNVAAKFLKDECKRRLAPNIPEGVEITFVIWADNRDDEVNTATDLLHARFILTERGAYQLDLGLDEADPPGSTTQLVTLLSEETRCEVASRFSWPDSDTYHFVDSVVIKGTMPSIVPTPAPPGRPGEAG